MTIKTYLKNQDNYIGLRQDVSPEMLEACYTRIFGMTLMTLVVERMPVLTKQLEDPNLIDDVYLRLTEKSGWWGYPVAEAAETLTFLAHGILGNRTYVDRFVDQTKKRLATVH